MKILFPIIILMAAIISGCGRLVDNSDWIEGKMYTIEAELPSNAIAAEPIIFTVKTMLPNSCWKFNRIRVISSNFDVYVTPYMRRSSEDLVCLDVVTPVSEEREYMPVNQGEYRFHFWRPDTLSLDYTVIVR